MKFMFRNFKAVLAVLIFMYKFLYSEQDADIRSTKNIGKIYIFNESNYYYWIDIIFIHILENCMSLSLPKVDLLKAFDCTYRSNSTEIDVHSLEAHKSKLRYCLLSLRRGQAAEGRVADSDPYWEKGKVWTLDPFFFKRSDPSPVWL